MSLTSRSKSSAPFLTESSASAASYDVVSAAASILGLQWYLAQGIEDVVEEKQDLAFGNLGDVIHAFAGIVSDACILVGEACQHGRNDLFQILGNLVLDLAVRYSPSSEGVDWCLRNRARWRLQRGQSTHRSGRGADGRHKRSRDIAGERSWLFGHCRRWRWLHG